MSASSSSSPATTLLEIPIQICLVGAGNTGKSILKTQLLQKSALAKIFDRTIAGNSDDITDLVAPNLIHSAKKDQYPPIRTFPAMDSLGTNHASEEFTMDLFGDGRVKIIFVFEIFEIGGASCCGKFMDADLIRANCQKADLVLAVYDLCDRTTLLSLTSEILPIICSIEVPDYSNASSSQSSPTIFITGTKIDARSKLTAEEKKNAVVGPDQKELELKFTSLLAKGVKQNPNGASDGVILDSVAAGGDGAGMMRLRREIFLEIFRRKKSLFEKLPLPAKTTKSAAQNKDGDDSGATPTTAAFSSLWNEMSTRQMELLDQNVGRSFAKSIRNSKRNDKNKKNEVGAALGASSSGSNNNNGGDDDEAPPVLDPKDKTGGKDKEKGASCGAMCGCTIQ